MARTAKTTVKAPSVDQLREPPKHPGEMLLKEFLRPQKVTHAEAARHLRISTTRLNELIRGKGRATARTAWRLGDWLGTDSEVWMNLQSQWDVWQARKVRKPA